MQERIQRWEGPEYWMEELEKEGYKEKLPPFSKLSSGRSAPPSYLQPQFRDVKVAGKVVDIYHYGGQGRDEVYLYIKN